jgi:hypothetical protein
LVNKAKIARNFNTEPPMPKEATNESTTPAAHNHHHHHGHTCNHGHDHSHTHGHTCSHNHNEDETKVNKDCCGDDHQNKSSYMDNLHKLEVEEIRARNSQLQAQLSQAYTSLKFER